jgi:hypothetical protein
VEPEESGGTGQARGNSVMWATVGAEAAEGAEVELGLGVPGTETARRERRVSGRKSFMAENGRADLEMEKARAELPAPVVKRSTDRNVCATCRVADQSAIYQRPWLSSVKAWSPTL